jgi:hypothetical protein
MTKDELLVKFTNLMHDNLELRHKYFFKEPILNPFKQWCLDNNILITDEIENPNEK